MIPSVEKKYVPLAMRKLAVLVLAFLVGTTVGVFIYWAGFTERFISPRQTEKAHDMVSSPPPSAPLRGDAISSPPPILPRTLREQEAAAWKLLHDGHLREAQDAFLHILSFDLTEQEAMRGLVAVRQQMAGEDPLVARQQAAVYQDAIRLGVETEEYYRQSAMEALVSASLQAANEIETRNKLLPSIPNTVTEASVPPASPQPGHKGSRGGKLSIPPKGAAKPTSQQKTLVSATGSVRWTIFDPKPQSSLAGAEGTGGPP